MKKSDLYREWARVLDMCIGTTANPASCWKFNGVFQAVNPDFYGNPGRYEFAVAILEGKPVFVGDKLYLKDTHVCGNVTEHWTNINANLYSWTTKTFMLNGEELPCPSQSGRHDLYIFGRYSPVYMFNTQEERDKVEQAINKLLTNAEQ